MIARAHIILIAAMFASLVVSLASSHIDPYFLDTPWTFAFSIFNQSIIYTNFLRNSTGGDLTWGYLFGDWWHLFLTYKAEEVSTSTTGSAHPCPNFSARLLRLSFL